MYVLMDGFVLGIGILAPFAEDEAQLDQMMNTAAPIWDGNETWLVLGGAGLLAAFPQGVRHHVVGSVPASAADADRARVARRVVRVSLQGAHLEATSGASASRSAPIAAAFAQGLMLGAIVEGMPLQGGKYLGGPFAWFSPFSMLTGVAVVFGYALLGSTWLILKTDGAASGHRLRADATARRGRGRVHGARQHLAAVLEQPDHGRWFESGNFIWLSPVPILALVNAVAAVASSRCESERSRLSCWR